jgi:hypothetical protein
MQRSGGWVAGLVLAIVVLALPTAAVASPGSQLWLQRYSTASDDVANAVVFSTDSTKVFATGTGAGGMVTWAFNSSTGAPVWSKNYTFGTNEGKAIGVSPDGSKVFVTGQSLVGGHYDYVTIAYSTSTGSRVWFQRFDSTSHLDDIPAALAVSPDGSKVFVTGSSVGSSSGQDYATVAYDAATGARLWIVRFNWTSLDDAATAIGVSPDGSKVFVTGSSVASVSGSDYATIAYDASSGARIWFRRFNGPLSNSIDTASALAVSPDGSKVYVSGLSEYNNSQGDGGDYSATTVAYSAAGTQVWSRAYSGSALADVSPVSLRVSPDGTRVYALTREQNGFGNTAYVLVAMTAPAGTVAWQRHYDVASQPDTPHGLAVGSDGQIYETGASGGAGSVSQDIATVAVLSSSTIEWSKTFNGAANGADTGNAIAVSPDGSKVAVVGSSQGSGTGLDWVTLVYSTS